ncbi:hypothetical protein AX14_009580, partial [Amanita brunnescens Koide BX004]
MFHGFTKISLLPLQQDLTKAVPQPVPLMKHSSYLFTACDEYLQELKNYFSSSIGKKRKSFLLYGLGGMGKTQICLKFFEENPGLFSNILWIDASSDMTIELGLKQIAQDTNGPNKAKESSESILKWIAQKDNWLMVYDGADGHYQILEKFLPPGGGGNILITSRNGGLKRIAFKSQKVVNM